MRKLVTVRKVAEVRPIDGADKIELVKIDGWQCVVKKGEFKPGDLCCYFEVDSYLPIEEQYEFLRKGCYRKLPELKDHRSEGFRLRTAKFLGVLSQGLALPLSVFPELQCVREGDDVTDILRIELFEPPLPAELAGEVLGNFPGYIPKTDEERIQNLPDYFEKYKAVRWEISEKIDGSSMSVFLYDGHFGVCGRNYEYRETTTNSYWKEARRTGIERELREMGLDVALQGELAGEGIQGNPLKLKGCKFYLYNIYDIKEGKYFSSEERGRYFKEFVSKGVLMEHVPVIGNMSLFYQLASVEALLDWANGSSLLNLNCFREGIVCKGYAEDRYVSFKVVSNNYLLKHGG